MQVETRAIEWVPGTWQRRRAARSAGLRVRAAWRLLAAGFAAGLALSAALAVAPFARERLADLGRSLAAPTPTPVPELAPEWRWQRPALGFDSMFRQAR